MTTPSPRPGRPSHRRTISCRGILAAGLLHCAPVTPRAHAAPVTQTVADAAAYSSFTNSLNWSNGQVPHPTNDYRSAFLLRTPQRNGNFTFNGGSLTLLPGAQLLAKGNSPTNANTITNLILSGGSLKNGCGANTAWTLAGRITLSNSSAYVYSVSNSSARITADLGGAAGLFTSGPATNEILALSGNNAGWSGGLTYNGGGHLHLNSGAAAGTGPFILNTSGGAATLDNSSGADITLSTAPTQSWNGHFTYAGTRSLNLGAGPVTLNADRVVTVRSNTLAVGGAIGGPFGLAKAGAGTLALHGSNTYAGATVVSQGVLRADGWIGTGAVSVAAGGTLGGSGVVAAAVACDGTLRPDGRLTLDALSLSASATLAGVISGPATERVAVVLGTAVLDGTLDVSISGYTPVSGHAFTVLTASVISGFLAATNLPASGGGLSWAAEVTATTVVVRVTGTPAPPDTRNLAAGLVIPDESYADQPYLVQSVDGSNRWLLVMTTGAGVEGQPGQHIISMVSTNQGQGWSAPVDIEPAAGPEASWAVPFITPGGRVYAFYTYNTLRDDFPSIVTNPPGRRLDTHGAYAFKYSDDFGQSWSARHEIPYRMTAVDSNNNEYGFAPGQIAIHWGVSKAFAHAGAFHLAFTKVGQGIRLNPDGTNNPLTFGESEGWMVHSTNLLTELDPAQLHWEMLPAAEPGLRNSTFGSVQEEHVAVPLNNGSFYCVYRTTNGFPCYSISTNRGVSWSLPARLAYEPGGVHGIKNPRANCKVWRTSNGRYLLWFHQNGGTDFANRNPAWLAGGEETNGNIRWSQPEILLYDTNTAIRMSYPDLVEHDGRYWITETQKSIARVHEIDATLLDGLWGQWTNDTVAAAGLCIDVNLQAAPTSSVPLPALASLAGDGGFTLETWVRFNALTNGQVIADSRSGGQGLLLQTSTGTTLRLTLNDGVRTFAWNSDPGLLRTGYWHHVAAIVDGAADIVTFVIDGRLHDGGVTRAFGWSFFTNALADLNGAATLTLGSGLNGDLAAVRFYDRYLRTSEVIGNFRAWTPSGQTAGPSLSTLSYDGTYDPYATNPPPLQATWNRGTAALTGVVDTLAGLLQITDLSTAALQRVEISHPVDSTASTGEWLFEARVNLQSATQATSSFTLGAAGVGVRDEGGLGRAALLMWFDDGLYLVGNAAGKDGTEHLVTIADYRVTGWHTYRIEKFYQPVDGVFQVQVYVDGFPMLSPPLPASALPLAASSVGCGFFGSSPATSDMTLDYLWFGPRTDWDGDGDFDPADPDDDADGSSDRDEEIAGTDPRNEASHFHLAGTGRSSAGPTVRWDGAANRLYAVWRSTNLVNGAWLPLPPHTNVAGFGQSLSITDTTGAAEAYYQIQVQKP